MPRRPNWIPQVRRRTPDLIRGPPSRPMPGAVQRIRLNWLVERLPDDLDEALGRTLGCGVRSGWRLSGGDVAESFAIELEDGRKLFAKTHRSPPAAFFSTEATGLGWLRDAAAVPVPDVRVVEDDPVAFLVLSWVRTGSPNTGTEAAFGRQLAALHRSTWSTFGRPDHRSTGSRGLPNEPCETWTEFYATQRLEPLARLAADAEALDESSVRGLMRVAERLEDLGGDPEPPSLLHGDLWAGNRLVDSDGASWLIDPAAHGGHREFDLAMMRLFGGFDEACFSAYGEVHPLADGWQQRIELHQIAPLVVHAIKFGGSYMSAASSAINRYR